MAQDIAAQEAGRLARVTRALGRTPDALVSSPRALGYRARIRLKVGPDGALGYHQPRSHTLVPVPMCAIARPEINAALAALPRMPPGLEAVELRSDGARVVLVAIPARRAGPDLAARLLALDLMGAAGLWGVALGGKTLQGDARLRVTVAGVAHRPGPGVFFQVNLEVNALLVEAVVEAALALSPTAVLDLYAGFGNLSLPLAARGVPVVGVESDPAAVSDAAGTIAREGLPAVFKVGDAGRFRAGDAFFDVAILDPPREGAGGVLGALVPTRPRGVLVVSCNPAALARDLRPALAAGYQISRVTAFDLFPQTAHVETLVELHRGPGRP